MTRAWPKVQSQLGHLQFRRSSWRKSVRHVSVNVMSCSPARQFWQHRTRSVCDAVISTEITSIDVDGGTGEVADTGPGPTVVDGGRAQRPRTAAEPFTPRGWRQTARRKG